mgnify:CR=1
MQFQTADDKWPDRKDHIWVDRQADFICCLCGAVTLKPPAYPTLNGWMPGRFEKLTDKLRDLCKEKRA